MNIIFQSTNTLKKSMKKIIFLKKILKFNKYKKIKGMNSKICCFMINQIM